MGRSLLARRSAVYALLICAYLLLHLPFLTRVPNVLVDEPWYGSVSHSLLRTGRMVTLIGQTNFASLYPVLLAGVFSLFGTSLLVGRLFSALAGLAGLLAIIATLRLLRVKNSIVLLCGLLYVVSNISYIVFRAVRPDSVVMPLVLWAVYFLVKAVDRGTLRDYLFCGILITASFLCHPNTALYMFLFGVVALWVSIRQRAPGAVVSYCVGSFALLGLLCLFIIFVKEQNLFTFFGRWLGRTTVGTEGAAGAASIFYSTWGNLAKFVGKYILGVKRLFILIFEIGILVVGLFWCRRNKHAALISALGLGYFALAICFLTLFPPRYFGPVVAMSVIAYGLLLQGCETRKRAMKYVLILAGAIYFLNNLAGDLYVIRRDHGNTSYGYVARKIDEAVPDSARVVTIIHYWFALKDNECYFTYTQWKKMKYESLDDLLSSGDVDYVVISPYRATSGAAGVAKRPASGGSDYLLKKHRRYFNTVHSFAAKNGRLVTRIITSNYGDIEVWQIVKRGELS